MLVGSQGSGAAVGSSTASCFRKGRRDTGWVEEKVKRTIQEGTSRVGGQIELQDKFTLLLKKNQNSYTFFFTAHTLHELC